MAGSGRRRAVIGALALVVAAGAAGTLLASGHHPPARAGATASTSTSTTVTDIEGSPYASAARTFLSRSGHPILAFERDTAGLGRGPAPTRARCRSLEQRELPALAGGAIFGLIDRIREPVLNLQLSQDVDDKMTYLSECSTGALTTGVATEVRGSSSEVRALLAELGLRA